MALADTRPRTFNGCYVLVVEDEYLMADELDMVFTDLGATVLGPVGSIEEAHALVAASPRIDCAVLDINVRGELIFPVAERLVARGVPIMFTTGYDVGSMPEQFADYVRCQKPVPIERIVRTAGRLIANGN